MDTLARQPRLKVVDGKLPPSPPPYKNPDSIIPELTDTPVGKTPRFPVNPETARWLSSMGLVLLIYIAPIVWWLVPDDSPGSLAPPPAAMVVELAPAPVAPPSPPDMPPGPEQAEAAQPSKPKPLPETEPEPEIPPAPLAAKPEVAVKPEPEVKPLEQQQDELHPDESKEDAPPEDKPASTASAPPDAQQEDDQAAAPNVGVFSPEAAQRKLTWQNSLMLKLNESKRYPSQARRYRQEGVVYLRFTMDRKGNVLAKRIEQSAGYPLLDEETLALIERAQPLPKPPTEMEGVSLEFVVPVEFFLRR